MNPRGIQTIFTFLNQTGGKGWPFKTQESSHDWCGWRLPAIPEKGTLIFFSTIPSNMQQQWEVQQVLMVHGEMKDDPNDDGWHIEVKLT